MSAIDRKLNRTVSASIPPANINTDFVAIYLDSTQANPIYIDTILFGIQPAAADLNVSNYLYVSIYRNFLPILGTDIAVQLNNSLSSPELLLRYSVSNAKGLGDWIQFVQPFKLEPGYQHSIILHPPNIGTTQPTANILLHLTVQGRLEDPYDTDCFKAPLEPRTGALNDSLIKETFIQGDSFASDRDSLK